MKKAKDETLDGTDALEAVRGDGAIPAERDTTEPEIDLGSSSFIAERNLDELPEPERRLTWKTLLFFGVPALCLTMAVVAGVIFFLHTDRKAAPAPAPAKTMQRTVRVAAGGAVSLDGLAAVVQDPSGKQRLVRFGITVMTGKGAGASTLKGEDSELRMAASRIVSGMSFPELLHDGGREQVRKKFKTHIEGIYGVGAAEHVWISSWVIL